MHMERILLTSAGHKDFDSNVLQQVTAREYCSDFRKVPFPV